MVSKLVRALFLSAVCALCSLQAQITSGTISVTAADTSGAFVTGASVKATNTATDVVRTGTTNDRGESLIPFVPVGPYTITVEYPGFKTSTISAVTIQVDQTAGVHVTLQPGEVREIVQVESAAALLETETT